MNTKDNLIKQVVLVDAELDRTYDIQSACIQLQSIRARMVKAGGMDKELDDLRVVIAKFQPYLTQPFFMELE